MGTTQFFAYDGGGNRLQAIRSGVITRYVYDAAGNVLAETNASNQITRYYIYGQGLLAMVTPAGQVYCYHYDATGNTIAMTDASKNIVNKYAYDAFGNIKAQVEGTGLAQPFKYVGQYGVMAEPNGFYYMRARYYDPKVGRFISEDPSGFGGGDVNLMAYVGNNPVMGIDPNGLTNWNRIFWGGIEAVSGAAVIGGAATATVETAGFGAFAVAGAAISGAAAMSHGASEIIAGALEAKRNPIPAIPSTSAAYLGALVVTGNVHTAEKVDLIYNATSFINKLGSVGVGSMNSWEGMGLVTDYLGLTHQVISSGCGGR